MYLNRCYDVPTDKAGGLHTMKKQKSERQRVELHAHTKMTEVLGICSARELINRAVEFGHSAVAITDDCSVQAFPEAERYGKEKGIKIIYGWESEIFDSEGRELAIFTALVKNQKGLKNLYKLVTQSFYSTPDLLPSVSKNHLENSREGLLLGSGIGGELFYEIIDKKPWDELCEIAKFYDYLEIYPIELLYKSVKFNSKNEIKELNRTVVRLGDELNIPVVACGDVYYLDPDESICHNIILSEDDFDGEGKQPLMYFRTTDEMLSEFSYLGEEKAYEVVVENTNLIADMIEKIEIIPRKRLVPKIENSESTLREAVYGKANSLYGNPLPDSVKARIENELESITKNDFVLHYEIARRLVKGSENHGYHVGSRGCVGSSLVAYLAGITEVNPLPPHYICHECHHIEFVKEAESGYDLPDKRCPKCNKKMNGDGHNIPFETLAGFDGRKKPDIDLNFASEYQKKAQECLAEILGNKNVIYAGTIGSTMFKTAYEDVKCYFRNRDLKPNEKTIDALACKLCGIKRTTGHHPGGIILANDFDIEEITPLEIADGKTVTHLCYKDLLGCLFKIDILAHTVQDMYHYLEKATGVKVEDIPMNEKEVYSLFTSPDALGVTSDSIFCETGSLALPECHSSFSIMLLKKCRPKCFSDLIKICGLSHGTGVWADNAEDLITSGTADLKSVIATRDDIFNYLTQKGFDREYAFNITELVRKGIIRRLSDVVDEALIDGVDIGEMRKRNIPEWYIESMKKIYYLFPKAHAAAYMTAAVRLGWYKLHYPAEFYAAYLTYMADELSPDLLTKGKEAVKARIKELKALDNELLDWREKEELRVLLVINEAMERGIELLPPEAPFSDKNSFTAKSGRIRFPLNHIPLS